jgi:hypothetical protein
MRPGKVKKIKGLIAGVCVAFFVSADGAGFPKPLESAETRKELIEHFGTTIGFGKVEKWEFTTAGRELIIFSYCPYSGRAACYVHAYYHDRAKHAWVLFIDRLLEPATSLSAEISADNVLVFKDRDGKVVAKQSIADLPQ